MTPTQRLHPEDRRQRILEAGLEMAKEHGYNELTRVHIAVHLRISVSLINVYFDGMAGLRASIMSEAIRVEELGVIAQGLNVRCKVAATASQALRQKAIKFWGTHLSTLGG